MSKLNSRIPVELKVEKHPFMAGYSGS